MYKKMLILLVVLFILVGCSCNKVENNSTKIIAYIPLDDRPINTTRAIYLANSAGFDILLPNSDYYKTKLDNQPLNSNYQQYGNIDELLKWLNNVTANYYVISIDQILSGGLVNSRVMTENDLSTTYQKIDEIFKIIKGKKVVFFDTVMRLSTTVGYKGCTYDNYNDLRLYGSLERLSLNGDFDIIDIYNNYNISNNNELINTSLDSNIINNYLNARKRKISISSYLLEKLKYNDNVYMYYGIDDSTPFKNIQTNEINYIQKNLYNGSIFAGTDELGLMSITKIIQMHYQKENSDLKAKVTYFGNMQNAAADEYDSGTLEENVNSHLESLNVLQNSNVFDFEILILTKKKDELDKNSYVDLLNKYKENIKNKIPTIIIDASTSLENGKLQKEFLKDSTINISYLIGYSNWNTVGNAIGIALSNGITRYLYLKNESDKTSESDIAFLKGLSFSFFKDICYKISGKDDVEKYLNNKIINKDISLNNFYTKEIEKDIEIYEKEALNIISTKIDMSINDFINKMKDTYFICDLNGGVKLIESIYVNSLKFTWYRSFEVDYDINVKVKKYI